MRGHWLFIGVLLLLPASVATAQASLCGGATGDPVINIDFGAGPNFGPPLARGTTNYNYVSGYPNDGSYTLANILGPSNNDWHKTPDHTPNDANGYALVVNASAAPGEFFRQRIQGLCDNSVYEFSAWIAVLNIPSLTPCNPNLILPNVRFVIQDLEGKILGETATGSLPASETVNWRRYGFSFTAPINQTGVEVVMINNAPGGCGNDLAIDDIVFRPCGDQLSLQALPSLATPLCAPDSVRFNVELGPGYTSPRLRWQKTDPRDSTRWLTLAETTRPQWTVFHRDTFARYRVLVANSAAALDNPNCRVRSNLLVGRIAAPPTFSLTVIPSCGAANGQLVFTPRSGPPPYQLRWSNGATGPNPVRLAPGTYQVTVTDAYGCQNTGQATIVLQDLQPQLTLAGPLTVILGESAQLQFQANRAGVQINWGKAPNWACQDCPQLSIRPARDTIVTYAYTTSAGCTFLDSLKLRVVRGPQRIYAPNVFSSGGSGVNAGFTLFADELVTRIESLQVYDRWGGLLFEKKQFLPNQPLEGWRGEMGGASAAAGQYWWRATVRLFNGDLEQLQGGVLLIH